MESEPEIEWNDDMQEQWADYWTRVIMHVPRGEKIVLYDEAAISEQLLVEYSTLVKRTSPYLGRAADECGMIPAASQNEETHMRWVRRMLVQSIPPAHAAVVRRGYLAGEGDRLRDGTMRLEIFIALANETSEALGQPERVYSIYAVDGSEVEMEISTPAIAAASAPSQFIGGESDSD